MGSPLEKMRMNQPSVKIYISKEGKVYVDINGIDCSRNLQDLKVDYRNGSAKPFIELKYLFQPETLEITMEGDDE